MERRGGVAGNKSPFKNYAGAQIRRRKQHVNEENTDGNKGQKHGTALE